MFQGRHPRTPTQLLLRRRASTFPVNPTFMIRAPAKRRGDTRGSRHLPSCRRDGRQSHHAHPPQDACAPHHAHAHQGKQGTLDRAREESECSAGVCATRQHSSSRGEYHCHQRFRQLHSVRHKVSFGINHPAIMHVARWVRHWHEVSSEAE